MLLTTQIPNLFQSDLKMTTSVVPKEILHPQIETDIISKYGDDIASVWIIRVLDTKSNNFIPYTCVMSSKGHMYRIEYIEVSQAYMAGYNAGKQELDITSNPYSTSIKAGIPLHEEWIKGYHEGYKHALEPNTPI